MRNLSKKCKNLGIIPVGVCPSLPQAMSAKNDVEYELQV